MKLFQRRLCSESKVFPPVAKQHLIWRLSQQTPITKKSCLMFVTPILPAPPGKLTETMASAQLSVTPMIKCDPFWEDREVRFDCSSKELLLRKGEEIIKIFKEVEDTKGNSGEMGTLTITSLRIIWRSDVKSRINLSIGLSTITQITCKQLHSKLRGRYSALDLMTKMNGTRYEFIYTHFQSSPSEHAYKSDMLTKTPSDCQALIKCISSVCKAYSATKLFRDLKLRSAIINAQSHELKALPGEQIYNKFQGVWNLSSDQGNLGTFILTSVRVVWYANSNEQFNLSLPLIQIQNVRVRESKFGRALVIESSESSGGYILGFRLDPITRLEQLYQELSSLYQIHASKPNLGVLAALSTLDPRIVSSSSEVAQAQSKSEKTVSAADFVEEDEKNDQRLSTDVISSYLALDDDTSIKKDAKVVYCHQLGLAMEEIKPGFTLESLWKVLPD